MKLFLRDQFEILCDGARGFGFILLTLLVCCGIVIAAVLPIILADNNMNYWWLLLYIPEGVIVSWLIGVLDNYY